MHILRTPDDRFTDLPGYPFAPNYIEIPTGDEDDQELRMHYVDEGPRAAAPVVMLHGEPSWSFLYRHMIPIIVNAGYRALTPDLIQSTIFSANNEGLTFIWMPQLFARVPFGQGLMILFFLALAFAAFTSLMAMIEMATRVLMDAGVDRPRAIKIVGVVGFVLGLPSAISLRVLHNQDWVWGVALMMSGLFFAVAVITHGVTRFRQAQLNHEHSDIRVGRWWDVVIATLVPLQALILLVWWLWQARGWNPTGWLGPFGEDSVGTILIGTGKGLASFAGGRFTFHFTTVDEARINVRFMTRDRRGDLWLAGPEGLLRFGGAVIDLIDD